MTNLLSVLRKKKKKQAIRRLINRDNLTEEQAKQRIDAQPSNEIMVEESTVVFSTQWSYEFSRQQVSHNQ